MRGEFERRIETNGWVANLYLGFEKSGLRTVLARKRQLGPLTVQRPFYPEGDVCHLYLLHPPGGVVGGDQLSIEVDVAADAFALLTTPGAAKLYRSEGAVAVQQQRLKVAAGGSLEWLPRENILFPGARLRMSTDVDLQGDARFIGWEMHSLGRPVIGERFDTGAADMGFSLYRDGRRLLADRLRVRGGRGLNGPSGLRGFPVYGTFVASGADAQALEAARELLPGQSGLPVAATLIDNLLVVRCLGPGVEPLDRIFRTLWRVLRPRSMGRNACPPRIWAT
jgi:urease accessory protein